jgi:hypothetical protein
MVIPPERGGTSAMDFNCIEGLLALPEFRVIRQVMNPKQLEFHLERRDTFRDYSIFAGFYDGLRGARIV